MQKVGQYLVVMEHSQRLQCDAVAAETNTSVGDILDWYIHTYWVGVPAENLELDFDG